MLRLRFDTGAPPRLALFLGAHCDDVEIGCGGTLVRLIQDYPGISIVWVTFSGNDVRERETRAAAARLLRGARDPRVIVHRFRNGYFPWVGGEIKDAFEALKREVRPDVIFTHLRDDLHQDHRAVAELTWNTFRDHLILEYEIPKYDGDLGAPNVFMPLDSAQCEEKVAALLSCFPSEAGKHWFSRETFMGLMRLRGMECNAPSGYAEAFYCRKMVF
jgi:LmbE family N-acetylglucosaminyl deacetylase